MASQASQKEESEAVVADAVVPEASDCQDEWREGGKVQSAAQEKAETTDDEVANDSQTTTAREAERIERQEQEKQPLDQISEDEEECDNGNEYYDHFPGERSSEKHAFTVAFYNSLDLNSSHDKVHGRQEIADQGPDSPPSSVPRRMTLTTSGFQQPMYKSCANSTSKSNKIVIDVPSPDTYEPLYPPTDEHIYEELVSLDDDSLTHKSMFDGASRDQILEYLEDAKERVQILITTDRSLCGPGEDLHPLHPVVDHTLEKDGTREKVAKILPSSSSATSSTTSSGNNRRNRSSNVSNSSTDSAVTTGSSIDDELLLSPSLITRSLSLTQLVERNDSGVGTETSKPAKLRRSVSGETELRCTDCDQAIDVTEDDVSAFHYFPLSCSLCDKKRSERKEIISEFVDTELKYGRDLRVIKEEFYRPMEVAGLMTKDQLKAVFINLDELILVNSRFSERLEDALEIACEQGDEVRRKWAGDEGPERECKSVGGKEGEDEAEEEGEEP